MLFTEERTSDVVAGTLAFWQAATDSDQIFPDISVISEPGIDIVAEVFANRRLQIWGQQIDSQIGCANVVRFMANQFSARIETRRRPRECKRHQQSHEPINRAFNRAQS